MESTYPQLPKGYDMINNKNYNCPMCNFVIDKQSKKIITQPTTVYIVKYCKNLKKKNSLLLPFFIHFDNKVIKDINNKDIFSK